jgi:hypothetical protein
VDDLGSYHHTAGSLHLYDTHFAMAEEVWNERVERPAPMEPFTLAELERLASVNEPGIRISGGRPEVEMNFGKTITWMREQLLAHRLKRDEEAKQKAVREAALDELVRLTEEAGGYEELKEKDVEQT